MNTVVYKYPLTNFPTMRLPAGAQVLHVDAQHGQPMLWAAVDPNAKEEFRDIYMVGTGHPLPELSPGTERRHLGSFLADGGAFVFHAFEDVQP